MEGKKHEVPGVLTKTGGGEPWLCVYMTSYIQIQVSSGWTCLLGHPGSGVFLPLPFLCFLYVGRDKYFLGKEQIIIF